MKLSCSHAAKSDVSDFCRDVTSCEKMWKEAKFGGETAAACESRPELGLEVCGSSLFSAPGLERSARPPTRLHPPPLSLTPMFPSVYLCLDSN